MDQGIVQHIGHGQLHKLCIGPHKHGRCGAHPHNPLPAVQLVGADCRGCQFHEVGFLPPDLQAVRFQQTRLKVVGRAVMQRLQLQRHPGEGPAPAVAVRLPGL